VLDVTGSAQLHGATLWLGEGCPSPGTTYTLLKAPGGITGDFDAPGGTPLTNDSTLPGAADGCGADSPAPPMRIEYSPETVDVTALEAPVAAAPCPGASPPPAGGSSSTGSSAVLSFTAIADTDLRGDILAGDPGARIRRLLRAGGETVAVRSPSGGTLELRWTVRRGGVLVTVASGRLSLTRAGEGRLHIRLTSRGRALLRGLARLRVKVLVSFTAPGRQPLTASGSLTLAGG
jgi:hypothetical protein